MNGTTLIITTHNRGHLLRNSLQRLSERTPPDEIIIVDDGGDDDTRELCEGTKLFGKPINYIYLDNPGVTLCSRARNVGLKWAQYPLVITSEPEIMFVSDVIEQMCRRHEDAPDKVISAGKVYVARSEGQMDPADCEHRDGWVAPYTALYRRDWLMELGGWDEGFPGSWGWDDTDLLTRLSLSGHGQIIDMEIEVLHQWHEPNMEDQSANEAHFRSKGFHAEPPERGQLVANQGRDWGAQ